jgi:hypothetical protein
VRTTLFILSACLVLGAGCGSEIGDSCNLYTDCSPTGDRICLTGAKGYCSIFGCDYGTCPDEAVCVRFFATGSTNLSCNPVTEDRAEEPTTNDCSPDEICTIGGSCVPRAGEIRYCMKSCDDSGDCREDDGYVCRTRELMMEYGGEPVPPPGERLGTTNVQSFCALALSQ